jgi:thymidylate kinase
MTNKKKIIAISATHGCGKTTQVYSLAAHLKKQGKNVVVLNELARECPFKINQSGEDRTQVWLIVQQVKREFELMDRYDYVITDRSLLDAYAYASVLAEDTWNFKYLLEYIIEHINTYYQKLYLLDPDKFKYNIYDGVRDNDETFRLKVHKKLSTLIHKNVSNYTYVLNDNNMYKDFY